MEKAEKGSPELSICLKCGSQISHIPYRYNGQVFHARCLLCNACGRRLIGKPFITVNRQIFCGDKCHESFLKGKSPKPPADPPHPEPSVSERELPTISIEDVRLDNTNTNNMPGNSSPSGQSFRSSSSRSDYQHLQQPPHSSHPPPPPPSRITDYPVASTSPLVTRTYSYQSNDSLSTLSESSFTSDSSSYTYEPHRKPKKKILKNSNAPKRRHKNRVHWDLNLYQYPQPQHERQYSDDTESLESSTSSFSGYLPPHLYSRETRTQQGWRDYERVSPTGGMALNSSQRLSQSQTYLGPTSHSVPQYRSLYRSYSGDIPPPSSYDYHLRRQYDSAQALHNHSPAFNPGSVGYRGYHTQGSAPPPVFYPDESNLPELDQSILEEKRRRHLYRIPQRLSGSGGALQTLSEDDKNDYDHLATPPPPPPPPPPSSSHKTVQERLSPGAPDNQWYTSEDIEEALQLINESGSQSDDEEETKTTPSQQSPSTVPAKTPKKSPPPPPPKRVSSLPVHKQSRNDPDGNNGEPNKAVGNDTSTNVNGVVDDHIPSSSSSSSSLGLPPTERRGTIILPPPPEFAHDNSTSKPHHPVVSESLTLSSPSMETLKSYLHSDSQSLDDGLTPEVHPETSGQPSLKNLGTSWGSPLKDRIVEGAEDPHRNISPPPRPLPPPITSTAKIESVVLPSTVIQESITNEGKPPLTNDTSVQQDSASSNDRRQLISVQQQMTSNRDTDSQSSPLHRFRTSPHNPSSTTSNNESNRSPTTGARINATVGQSQTSSSPTTGGRAAGQDQSGVVGLTKEEEATVQWLKQSRTMKPVVVDTDKEIEQMMAGLGKSGRHRHSSRSSSTPSLASTTTRQKYFGTCNVCQKPIENSQNLFSFASRLYHTKCFCCTQCGCPLRGKQIYTIKGTLVCTDDYNKLTSSSSSNHSLPAVALMKDSRDPVLFQRIIKHSPSPVSRDGHTADHMINGEDHMINSIHNSATMV